MDKLKIWQPHTKWEEGERKWDAGVSDAALKHPLKTLRQLPSMPGITPETSDKLKWKSLRYMLTHDHEGAVRRGFLKHPIKYLKSYLRSFFKTKGYERDDDFFLYGVNSLDAFLDALRNPNALFVVGFSYCQKPFECPSGRFTPDCIRDSDNAVCRQCFVGKALNALPDKDTVPLLIPTVHYIGGKIFELIEKYPERPIVFMITACELTLEMFADWGNMVGINGIGVRLDGRICNTMKAFELSEAGIKPGLTVVLDGTQRRMLDIIKHYRELKC